MNKYLDINKGLSKCLVVVVDVAHLSEDVKSCLITQSFPRQYTLYLKLLQLATLENGSG